MTDVITFICFKYILLVILLIQGVFLHDPSLRIEGVRVKSAIKQAKSQNMLIPLKDTFYWPDMMVKLYSYTKKF
jgi:hypothetical protein